MLETEERELILNRPQQEAKPKAWRLWRQTHQSLACCMITLTVLIVLSYEEKNNYNISVS
jgi:hypothetical protein